MAEIYSVGMLNHAELKQYSKLRKNQNTNSEPIKLYVRDAETVSKKQGKSTAAKLVTGAILFTIGAFVGAKLTKNPKVVDMVSKFVEKVKATKVVEKLKNLKSPLKSYKVKKAAVKLRNKFKGLKETGLNLYQKVKKVVKTFSAKPEKIEKLANPEFADKLKDIEKIKPETKIEEIKKVAQKVPRGKDKTFVDSLIESTKSHLSKLADERCYFKGTNKEFNTNFVDKSVNDLKSMFPKYADYIEKHLKDAVKNSKFAE